MLVKIQFLWMLIRVCLCIVPEVSKDPHAFIQSQATEGKFTLLGRRDTRRLSRRIGNPLPVARPKVPEGSNISATLLSTLCQFQNSDIGFDVSSNYVAFTVSFLLSFSPVAV
jgi:hypothetical protein